MSTIKSKWQTMLDVNCVFLSDNNILLSFHFFFLNNKPVIKGIIIGVPITLVVNSLYHKLLLSYSEPVLLRTAHVLWSTQIFFLVI